MVQIGNLFAGEIVAADAPTRMVDGTHYSLTYIGDTSELEFTLIQAPSAGGGIGGYIVRPHPRDPDIGIPRDGPFPFRAPFNAFSHPRAWKDKDGLAVWDATPQVGAKGLDGTPGRLSPTVVPISAESIVVPAANWSYEEITDSTEAGGVSGKFRITVVAGIVPLEGFTLHVAATGLPYVAENFAAIQAAAVPAVIGGTVEVASGMAAGATAYLLLLWHYDAPLETPIIWRRASENVAEAVVLGVSNPLKPIFTQPPIINALGGVARIGAVVTGQYAVSGATSVAVQWLRGTQEISGAATTSYVPVPADDEFDLFMRVRATNANGTTERISNALQVLYPPPQATGSLPNVTVDEETDGSVAFAAAPQFSGIDLTFSVSGRPEVSINPTTGAGLISIDEPIPATTITVAATNSGGVAQITFTLTVNDTPDGIVWPADIASGLWSAAEVTDPSEASANGFAGEDGHIKAIFSASIEIPGGEIDPPPAGPLYPNSIASTSFDLIHSTDPSAVASVTYVGFVSREVPFRGFINVHCYAVTFTDCPNTIEIYMTFNSEDGSSYASQAAARVDVDKYTPRLGKLPLVYRRNIHHMIGYSGNGVDDSSETLSSEDAGHFFMIYADRANTRIANNDLEESFFHEATHASIQRHGEDDDLTLDDYDWLDSSEWAAAVAADDDFITEYATTDEQEDFAEHALFAYTLIFHPERLPEPDRTWIMQKIPNRIEFFRANVFDPDGDPVTLPPGGDFSLYWTPFGGNPGAGAVAVVPGTTQYSTTAGALGTAYTSKIWWKHNASGTFKEAGSKSVPALQGLDEPPDDDEHPRTVYNATDLATIKARVNAGTQPQRNAWLNTVLPAANSTLSFTADPDATYGFAHGSGAGTISYSRAEFTRNARAAYVSALAWRQTNDTRYANKAVQILNAWAQRGPQISPDGQPHPGLHISSHLTMMLYAVDVMRGYAPYENIHDRFKTWWENEPKRNIRAVISQKMPGWPGNRNQVIANPNSENIWTGDNWLDHAINAMLTTGTVFDDNSLVDEIISRMEDWFISNWRIKKYPYGPGGASVAGQVSDINRSSDGVFLGVSYTGYGMSSMMQALKTARHHGVNLFNRKTPLGVGHQEIVEQWYRWTWGGDSFRGTQNFEREKVSHTNILPLADSVWNMSTQFKNFVANGHPWSNGLMESYPSYVNVKASA